MRKQRTSSGLTVAANANSGALSVRKEEFELPALFVKLTEFLSGAEN
jgi:hypothetical protein